MIDEPSNSYALPPRARITMRKNSTGETFVINEAWEIEATLHSVFWFYSEGNWSCDCNRHDAWIRSHGGDDHEVIPCRDEETGGNEYTMVAFEAAP